MARTGFRSRPKEAGLLCRQSSRGDGILRSSDALHEREPSTDSLNHRSWIVTATSLFFILLQSACTAVMAISGIRVVIGMSALAAAGGLGRPATGFHADAIRIPMMLVAVGGSLINLYVIWRIRSLRARPAAQWRTSPVPAKRIRSENLQIALAVITLLLVATEWATHRIVHNVP